MKATFSVYNLFKKDVSEINGFLVKFYIIGIAGILIPATRSFFLLIFPAAIILSFILLIAFPDKKPVGRFYPVVILIIIIGFFIEVAGVNTGKIFGEYFYGKTFGPKVLDTPPLIGLNWALLVLAAGSVTQKLKTTGFLKIFSASLLMVAYDFIMEISAPELDMWYWKNNSVPVRNYVAWFGIALLMNSFIKLTKSETYFKTAPAVLLCQMVFFILLSIYFKFV